MSDTPRETPMVVCDFQCTPHENGHGGRPCPNPRPAPAAVPQTAQGVADAPAKTCGEVYNVEDPNDDVRVCHLPAQHKGLCDSLGHRDDHPDELARLRAESAALDNKLLDANQEVMAQSDRADTTKMRLERDLATARAENVAQTQRIETLLAKLPTPVTLIGWREAFATLEKQLAAARAEGDALRAEIAQARDELLQARETIENQGDALDSNAAEMAALLSKVRIYLAKRAALALLPSDSPDKPKMARELADTWIELNHAVKEKGDGK